MIRHYIYSKVGQYHIDAGSDICQDAAMVIEIDDNVSIAAVADGVGSEEHSEYASQAAVKACCEYCRDHYRDLDPKTLINNSFYAALFAVQDASREKGIPMTQLHCTLCAVLYTENALYCGNVGDSGAIGLHKEGRYELLTRPQNDEEGRVMPLSEERFWKFDSYEGRFTGVLLATDGFYNHLFPPYLPEAQNDDFNQSKQYLDEETVSEYLDTNLFDDLTTNEKLQEHFNEKLDAIPREGSINGIIDDLTVIGLLSTDKPEKIERAKLDKDQLIASYTEQVKRILYNQNNDEDSCTDDTENNKKEEDNQPMTLSFDEGSIAMKRSDFTIGDIEKEDDEKVCFNVTEDISFVRIKDECLEKMDEDMIKKIEKLCKISSEEIGEMIELPYKMVYSDDNGDFIGYLIKKIERKNPICDYYNQLVQKRYGIAYILSNKISKLNEKGIHIKKMNDQETSYNDANYGVILADVDLKDILLLKEDQIVESESESLSEIIFKLLFNGVGPLKSGEYIFKDKTSEYKNVPKMDAFPPNIQDMFQKTFDEGSEGKVPTPKEWMIAIQETSDNIKKCEKDATHVYYKEAKTCPYCECKNYSKEL